MDSKSLTDFIVYTRIVSVSFLFLRHIQDAHGKLNGKYVQGL
jgi:hypothetical protein